ncbi:MAG: glycogen-binding domain-containing protein, partial [Flavobacteriales bacterium]
MISRYPSRFNAAVLASLFMLVACGSAKLVRTSVIPGDATPIQLKFDTTQVYMSDYLPDWKQISSIQWNGSYWNMDEKSRITLVGKAPSPVSNMHVVVGMNHFDVPVFSSTKQMYTFTYKSSQPNAEVVELAGSVNGWNRKATPLHRVDNGWQTNFVLEPGTYAYRIWEDGHEMLDANQSETMDNGMGGYNSVFRVGNTPKSTDISPVFVSQTKPLTLSSYAPLDAVYMYCENQLVQTYAANEVERT